MAKAKKQTKAGKLSIADMRKLVNKKAAYKLPTILLAKTRQK